MLRERSRVEQRYDAVLAVIRKGIRVSEVAEKFGVHRDTVRTRLAHYEVFGIWRGLRPQRAPQPWPSASAFSNQPSG
jgi:transposase